MAHTQTMIANRYVDKESYHNVRPWLLGLKARGLSPFSVTMDGHMTVIEAMREVWPGTIIQRCLYHIHRQGLQWLRAYPKIQASKDLRSILLMLCTIHSVKDQNIFTRTYQNWLDTYQDFVKSLLWTNSVSKDLKRAMGLLNNALPDMFHYLKNSNIPATTNTLEGFYSRLKADYRRHRGLTQKNKIQYLKWYCYFKNSNTF